MTGDDLDKGRKFLFQIKTGDTIDPYYFVRDKQSISYKQAQKL